MTKPTPPSLHVIAGDRTDPPVDKPRQKRKLGPGIAALIDLLADQAAADDDMPTELDRAAGDQ